MKHRKLFPAPGTNDTTDCPYFCDPTCPFNYNCVPLPDIYFPEPPPPPAHHHHTVSPYVIIFVSLVASFFVFVLLYVVVSKARGCNSGNNGPQQAQSDDSDEEFLDGNRVDHPIWLIHTVGLQQSIINSITVCKYKKGEGLIEGTECSVCLNEFQEDESVRLLPKCNHAFHISCIDTWLRSHINCPMCRARIVPEIISAPLMTVDRNSDGPTLTVDAHIENSEIDGVSGENRERNREDCENRTESEDVEAANDRILKDSVNSNENEVIQVIDDSGDENDIRVQPMRRSVSLDSSLAETICLGLADFGPVESGEFPFDPIKDAEKSHSAILMKQDGPYSSMSRLTGSSAIRQCLHKGPVSMKRSFSCSGRFLSSKRNRNLNAILPL